MMYSLLGYTHASSVDALLGRGDEEIGSAANTLPNHFCSGCIDEAFDRRAGNSTRTAG
jgi:hypothetical protein